MAWVGNSSPEVVLLIWSLTGNSDQLGVIFFYMLKMKTKFQRNRQVRAPPSRAQVWAPSLPAGLGTEGAACGVFGTVQKSHQESFSPLLGHVVVKGVGSSGTHPASRWSVIPNLPIASPAQTSSREHAGNHSGCACPRLRCGCSHRMGKLILLQEARKQL